MNFAPALVSEVQPLELKEELPAEALALHEINAQADEPVLAELLVTRDGESLLVTGWVRTTVKLQCGRCAEWFAYPIRAEIEHLLEAPHPNSIDLTPSLREDILLELPLNAACRLGADGRCPVTGEIYRPRPQDSGSLTGEAVWEALSKIKPKD